jgi:hypothetical protein
VTKLVAIAEVRRTPNDAPPTELAGFDSDGNSIIQAVTERVTPGTIFDEPDPVEARWLINHGGAREATEKELDLYKHFGPGMGQ